MVRIEFIPQKVNSKYQYRLLVKVLVPEFQYCVSKKNSTVVELAATASRNLKILQNRMNKLQLNTLL